MPNLAQYLKTFRAERNLTQEAIGISIGISQNSARQRINKIEKGEGNFTFDQVAKFIEVYRVDPLGLLGLSPGTADQQEMPLPSRTEHVVHDVDDDFIPVFSYSLDAAGALIRRVIGSKPRPPALRSVRDAYAFYVNDEAMWPRYKRGCLLWINPGKPVPIGRDALIFPKDRMPVVRELQRKDHQLLGIALDNEGDDDISLTKEDAMHLVVGVDLEA
ncbi:MAG TPA: helix-turn-helix domain-containing protein [Stellaceae bacterium]|nr:helix-turn-helix domain-containing protein [Stellaceae bacterium]